MIENYHQLAVTKERLKELKAAVKKAHNDYLLARAGYESILSVRDELKTQVAEYEQPFEYTAVIPFENELLNILDDRYINLNDLKDALMERAALLQVDYSIRYPIDDLPLGEWGKHSFFIIPVPRNRSKSEGTE